MAVFYSFIVLMLLAILLVGIAQKIQTPYPIALVLGGLIFGFLPGITPLDFNPNLLLVIVLPPILYYASYSLSFKEFFLYFRDILSVAIGLVLATTLVVALLFKWFFPELSWGLAFAFGALISPPDAVTATTILKRFSISSRLKTILEGESLVNDATALVIYRFAVLAIITGSFSLKAACLQVFYVASGGIILGFIIGYLFYKISFYLSPVLAVAYSYIIPYATYSLADSLGASGVLAVVVCGLFGARMWITQFTPLTRVLGWAYWDIIIILLNCFVFILIGLEFKQIVEKMSLREIGLYGGYGVLLTLAIIAMRYLWIYTRRGIWHLRVRKDPFLERQSKEYLLHAVISGWAGMRGIVSLTAALALPLNIPGRDIALFLTFEIIFLTLVIPGLTLPWLIKKLNIKTIQNHDDMVKARHHLAAIAKEEIVRLHATKHLDEDERDLLTMYFHSQSKIMCISSLSEEHKIEKARHQILQKQREHLLAMWRRNEINDILMSHLERELDIAESHLVRGEI